jgi:protein TonB
MRCKMLGLAIALTTFGLGVAATTAWIAYHTPHMPAHAQVVFGQFVPGSDSSMSSSNEEATGCPATTPSNAARANSLTISGGVLNGKAVSKPVPVYPPIARAAQASGVVVVQVKIDECGNVVAARAISGHPLLQYAAVQAAYNWRFSPTLLSGQPVKVTGTITFNFLLQ